MPARAPVYAALAGLAAFAGQAAFVVASVGVGIARADALPDITVPGTRVYPESLTTAPDGAVLVGSVGERAIFRAAPGAALAQPWIAPGTDGLASVLGVYADERSGTLWACSVTLGSAPGAPPSTLHAFDVRTGAPRARYPLPTAGALCNDVAVAPDGTLYATDSNNMQILRLKRGAQALEVWAGDAFGPVGGILDGIVVLRGRVLVNVNGTGRLFAVPIGHDGRAGRVQELQLDRPLEKPDGMRVHGRDAVLVVESGGGGRLSQLAIGATRGRVATLREGFPDGPAGVTVVGRTAYVLEAQFATIGSLDAPAESARPFRATAVELPR